MIDAIKRGAAAGAVAGAIYGLFVWLVISPVAGYMEGLAHHGHEHGNEHVVTEATTALVSAGGGVLWGILLGAGFGAAYYLFGPAIPGGRFRAYVLAGAGLLTVSAAPWLVLPPAPSGTEQALAIETRILAYVGLMALGALTSALAVAIYNRTARRTGRPLALAAGCVPLAALGSLGVAAPATLAAGEAPGELVTAFTWLVVFGQSFLWALVAASFVQLQGIVGTTKTTPTGYPAD